MPAQIASGRCSRAHVWSLARPLFLAAIFLAAGSVLFAQNLVPNHNFDHFTNCPTTRGEIHLAAPWFSPNGRTTDFVHECAGHTPTGVPENNWGTERPVSGRGYAGIRTWLPPLRNLNQPYREYLAVKLLDTLVAGDGYLVSFQVSVGDSAQYTSDDIGLYLSKDTIPAANLLTFSPAIANLPGRVIFSADGWLRISGQYTAKGGEQYLVIGNFLDDANTTLVDRQHPDGQVETTYFFIDEVKVEPCKVRFPEKMILAEDSVLCPGGSVQVRVAQAEKALYSWDDGSRDTVRQLVDTGLYVLETYILGCRQRDTFHLRYAPLPEIELGNDTTLCPGASLLLQLKDTASTYLWGDGSTGPSLLIQQAGTYRVQATKKGCSVQDSMVVSYEEPYVQRAPTDTLLCRGARIQLLPSVGNASYVWQDLSSNQSLTVEKAGSYYVDIRTSCFEAREHFVVQHWDCGCESFVPNVFSPNGDGIHDLFLPQFREGIDHFQLTIVDRWGKVMFQSRDPQQHWNGTYRGSPAPEGVYFWALSYRCFQPGGPNRQLLKGTLSLLR